MANKSRRTFFMPLLCRPSQNNTVQPSKLHHSSTAADPSSPKLSCIGQIKKRSTTTTATATVNNNRFLVCSLSDSTTARSTVTSNRYTKLHKLFSGKNLISPAIDAAPINKFNGNNYKHVVTKRSKSCNGRGRTPISKKKCYISSDDLDIVRTVAIKELDPPLPVVKCCRRDEESNVNLWKRRGVEMKALQIQPIKLTMNRNCSNNNGELSIPTSATTV